MKVFNLFYVDACKMDALHYRELLDIAPAATYRLDYYKHLRARYNSMIFKDAKELPPRPPAMYLDSNAPDRKDIVMGIFRSVKRGMGYG